MDSTKLENEFYKSLPFWLRVKNNILNVSDFFYGAFTLFQMTIALLLILPFIVIFSPFVLLYKITAYYLFRKR